MPSSRLLLPTLLLLLSGAVALLVYSGARVEPVSLTGRVADLLPHEGDIPGWHRELRPIADTPEARHKVAEILNYDDAVYAIYTRGPARISVYIAHWRPGKMSHRLVAGHTPDVCWTGAGWTCTVATTNAELTAAGLRLFPAQQRHMVQRGAPETVLFWHLVGGAPVSYGPARPPWHSMFSDLWQFGLRQRHEQYFIRISSGAEDLAWWSSEPVQKLGRRLRMLQVGREG